MGLYGIDYNNIPTPPNCHLCGSDLPLKVCVSHAGYYVGKICPKCGPYSRESGYFSSPEEMETQLTLMYAYLFSNQEELKEEYEEYVADMQLSGEL